MDLSHSLDVVVRTSDDTAVRAHFEKRTLMWLRFYSILGAIASFPHAIAAMHEGSLSKTLYSVTACVLSVLLVLGVRKQPGAFTRFVHARVRGVAIGYGLVMTAFLALYHAPGEGGVAIPIMIAMGAIGYRLLPAEHVLLHAGIAAIAVAVNVAFPYPKGSLGAMILPTIVASAMFLGVALFISSRIRGNVIADWSERRTSAREQIRMRDELRYARELQLSMLPEGAPPLEWADLCALSTPASEVGGDYYDYFTGDDEVALVCGDVAGHGMAAGLVLAAIRAGFTLMKDSLHDPAAVLHRLHGLVSQTSRQRMLVTVTVVLLNRKTGQATIANAGHPPVLLRHADGNVEVLELYAPPLGVRLPVRIPQRTVPIQSGDVFVLHSDGIYEARNLAGEAYGFDRLANIVREHGSGDAQSIRDAIVADVEAFRGPAIQSDDLTVVVARIA